MNSRGVTLVEILVVTVIAGLLFTAALQAFSSEIDYDRRLREGQSQSDQLYDFELRLTDLVERAFLSIDNAETTFFVGSQGLVVEGTGGSIADTLTFTNTGTRLANSTLNEVDFETINADRGAIGGIRETCISLTPTGGGNGRQGLFVREQTPADGDPSQGGRERVFDANIETVSYEFWDGETWQTTWDTRAQTTRRLPAAVRVTYRRVNADMDRVFVIRLLNSDVTVTNPVTEVTGG
ncbi:MAG: type II secretion system protein GspJ [Fimbriimonadaceae bacterium]|nr:type II secretion system protein GspJ [Fimbriimonadaceae bacterium]